tara:strand:- start:23227 stop:23601 length:375 start_codon:yes stop_codon:yes gene_type:complete
MVYLPVIGCEALNKVPGITGLRFKENYWIVIFRFLFSSNGNMAYDIRFQKPSRKTHSDCTVFGGRSKNEDLKRSFDLGWNAGFRGPWCFESANKDQKQLFRELVMLREMLQGWMNEAEKVDSHQ